MRVRAAALIAWALLLAGCQQAVNATVPNAGDRFLPDPNLNPGALDSQENVPSNEELNSPMIASLTASPSVVASGSSLILLASGRVPNDSIVYYSWRATGGTLANPYQNQTSWQPPTIPGTYTVTISVTNPLASSDNGTLTFVVNASGSAALQSSSFS